MRRVARESGQASEQRSARQRWMSILARASVGDLEEIVARHGGVPAHAVLKPAEVGTVMIEARAGGTGVRFNAGEATVTRCIVRLDSGLLGFSMSLGTDRRKALLAAIVDAWLQHASAGIDLVDEMCRLAGEQSAARELMSRKAAQTKVEFFTLVRGND